MMSSCVYGDAYRITDRVGRETIGNRWIALKTVIGSFCAFFVYSMCWQTTDNDN